QRGLPLARLRPDHPLRAPVRDRRPPGPADPPRRRPRQSRQHRPVDRLPPPLRSPRRRRGGQPDRLHARRPVGLVVSLLSAASAPFSAVRASPSRPSAGGPAFGGRSSICYTSIARFRVRQRLPPDHRSGSTPIPERNPRVQMINRVLTKIFGSAHGREVKRMLPVVAQINDLEARIKPLSDAELRGKTVEFRTRIDNGEALDDLLPEAFAVAREGAWRTVHMRPFDVQLM